MRAQTIFGSREDAQAPEQRRSLTHEGRLERREDDVGRREVDLRSREKALAARLKLAQAMLVAARVRDTTSAALDAVAEQREQDLDLAQMLSSASDGEYGADWPARRHAALARAHAKADRLCALEDLAALVDLCGDHVAGES